MSAIKKLLASRPWIKYIDDEREIDNGIIVTLANGWCFADEPNCGVRGYDTIAELKADTAKDNIIQIA